MDGRFVPDISFGPVIVESRLPSTQAFLGAHLDDQSSPCGTRPALRVAAGFKT